MNDERWNPIPYRRQSVRAEGRAGGHGRDGVERDRRRRVSAGELGGRRRWRDGRQLGPGLLRGRRRAGPRVGRDQVGSGEVRPSPRVPGGPLDGRRHGVRTGRARRGCRPAGVPGPDGEHVQRGAGGVAVDRRRRRRVRDVQRGVVRVPADRRGAQHVHRGQPDAVRHVRRDGHRRAVLRRPQPPGRADHVGRDRRAAVRRRPERRHAKKHRQLGAVSEDTFFCARVRAAHVPRTDRPARVHRGRTRPVAVGGVESSCRSRPPTSAHTSGGRDGRRDDVQGPGRGGR